MKWHNIKTMLPKLGEYILIKEVDRWGESYAVHVGIARSDENHEIYIQGDCGCKMAVENWAYIDNLYKKVT